MTIDITEQRRDEILNCFIENPNFYKRDDLKSVREILSIQYSGDHKIIARISKNKKSRQLLGSPALLISMMNKFTGADWLFESSDEIDSEDVFFAIEILNKYDDDFYTNELSINALNFIRKVVGIVDEEILNSENSNKKIENLFAFFCRVIERVKISQENQKSFHELFNKIEQVFLFNNYINASIWFRFYFYYRDKKKFNNNIESNVVTHVSTFIRSATNPKQLKKTIESVLPVEEFIKIVNNYLNELFKKSTASPDFVIEFYSCFDEAKKQSLLESWIQHNSNNATTVIQGITEGIPNKQNLANKIVTRANSLNNNLNEKKAFLDLLFSLNLSKDDIMSTDYSNQIAGLLFSTNINLQNFGVEQLKEHREFIDTKSMKSKAETFMKSILSNPNSYNKHIQNIISSRLGITTTFIDKFIVSNQGYINAIFQYLINSGNIEFYTSITSKLNKSTITLVINGFIRGINKHQKYYGIVNHIKNNYFEYLDNNNQLKIKTLIDE